MRNLKKFLALVLAMMMVMGLMVTANAATDFPDDAEINASYAEAVQIMNTIGVIKGDEGGFRPKDKITRAEFAKLLYAIDTGDTELVNADSWTGLANFSDVPENEWYAGVVAYAQIRGYVKGDEGSGGPFRPDEWIDGYETLTALDRLLGEKIEGDNWRLDAAVKAGQLGINAGVKGGSYYSADTTRELASQLVFNTLFYTSESGYVYTVYIDVDATGGSLNYYDEGIDTRLYQGPDYNQAMLYAQSYNALVDSVPSTAGSLADNNFNGLHRLESKSGRDVFQRPTTIWVDNDYIPEDGDSAIIVAEFPHTPIATYYGNFTGKVAKDLVGAANVAKGKAFVQGTGENNGIVDVYYNGGLADDYKGNAAYGATNGTVAYEKDGTTVGGNGMWIDDNNGVPGYEVEIYEHTATGSTDLVRYDIIVREALVGQVGATNSTTKNITLTVYEESYMAGNGENGKALTIAAATPIAEADDIYDDVAAFSRNTYIGVYAKPGWENAAIYGPTGSAGTEGAAIAEVVPLDESEITIRQINDNAHKYNSTITTTAGAVCTINNEAMVRRGSGNAASIQRFVWGTNTRNFNIGDATLYTLKGSILIIDQSTGAATTTSGYAYLYDYKDPTPAGDIYWESQGGNGTGYTYAHIRMLTADNEYIEAALHPDNTDTTHYGNATDGDIAVIDADDLGNLVHYVYDRVTDTYKLSYVNPLNTEGFGDATPGFAAGKSTGFDNTLSITRNKSEGKVPQTGGNTGAALGIAFDSKTKFIVVTTTPATATAKKDWIATANVYDIYTVPNITADNGRTYVTAAKKEVSNASGGLVASPGDIASVVLIIDAGNTSTADGYYFVLGQSSAEKVRVLRTSTRDYYEYIEYAAVVDGVLGKVKVKVYDSVDTASNVALAALTLGNEIKFVKNPTMDSNGCITNWGTGVDYTSQSGHPTDTNVIYDGSAVTKYENDHVKISGATLTGGQEDYLVSAALSVAFKYNVTDGVLEQIAVEDIEAQTAPGAGSANNSNHYAIRNTEHTMVSALFIAIDDEV